jgi:hypothetical protein
MQASRSENMATSSLVLFENKKIIPFSYKNAPACYNAGVVVVNL